MSWITAALPLSSNGSSSRTMTYDEIGDEPMTKLKGVKGYWFIFG
jgi:hypothetical protein